MDEARTWFVKMNLDELNALYSSLWMEADKTAALHGMVLGCNGGPCPDGVPDAFKRAWEMAHRWRAEAEAFRASKVVAGKASAAARAEKFGTSQPLRTDAEQLFDECSDDVRTNQEPEPNIQELTIRQPNIHLSISVPFQKGQKGEGSAPVTNEFDERLGDHKESYWMLVAMFGLARNGDPAISVGLYLDAIQGGTSPERIQACAQEHRSGVSGVQFMPQLIDWLKRKVYLTPVLPKMSGVNHGSLQSPGHRTETDRVYVEQLLARKPTAEKAGNDGDDLSGLWEDESRPAE